MLDLHAYSLLIKPVSADCNLRCRYCFYRGKTDLYPHEAVHRMSDATLERLIVGYLATSQPVYSFIWQGGEPTLLGLDFWLRVTDLQKKHGRPGSSITNSLQTNATLIKPDLARYLAKYRFLVGVSLDGPAEAHDTYRRTHLDKGSHDAVMRGVRHLREAGVEFNALTLVSAANVSRASEIYRYLCDQGMVFQQYIPCVEFEANGRLQPYAVDADGWGRFLCELFDKWHPSDTHRVSIRLWDAILHQLVFGRPIDCSLGSDCCHYFLVEYNGDVYPCDFFVSPQTRLGNIHRDDWKDLSLSPAYLAFGRRKADRPLCNGCRYLALCHGDCPRHRPAMEDAGPTRSVLCAGWMRFLSHTLPHFERLAAELRASLRLAPQAVPGEPGLPAMAENEIATAGSAPATTRPGYTWGTVPDADNMKNERKAP